MPATRTSAGRGAGSGTDAVSGAENSGGGGVTLRQPASTEIIRQSAVDLATKIKSGELSAVEVTRAHLDRIAEIDDKIHAFLYVDGERALASAARVDTKIASGEEVGPLAG